MKAINAKKFWARCAMAMLSVFFMSLLTQKVYAEGTKDMDEDGDGYRPYTERNKAYTFGKQRLSHMQVYLKKGETVYFGTSVANGTLYDEATQKTYFFTNQKMGTDFSDTELTYLNSADIWVYQGTEDELSASSLPYANNTRNENAFLIDIPANATNTTPGYIYNGLQEDGGADLSGNGTGYKVTVENTLATVGRIAKDTKRNANTFTAPSDGIYTVVFFSASMSAENPTMMKLSDKTTPFAKTQKGSTIASWDISVYSDGQLQTGRVFTKTLFLNMGGNALVNKVSKGSLYSNIYAVTNDGYQYKVDFNGMDPYGFVFFANNRGLLKTNGPSTSSLYHGLRSDNNTLSDVAKHGIATNIKPYDKDLDQTYNMFYEKPSAEALAALHIEDPASSKGGITNFKFTGNGSSTENLGYVGKGGTFSFSASEDITATSYQLELDFSSANGGASDTVVLANTLNKGWNTITWDGKDANGNVVPAGTFKTLNASIKLKGGEVHFPLLDVEQNVNGVKIDRLNGEGSSAEKNTVFFNNSAANAGDASSPWTIEKNWEVGSQTDASVNGVDTSSTGAMAFTNVNTLNGAKKMTLLGDGDQSALDLWAYYNTNVSLNTWSFTLVPSQFTVTKIWDNTDGTPNAGNPNVTMTLQKSTDAGKTWTRVTADAQGNALINPVTYNTAADSSYTWHNIVIPSASLQYRVQEKSLQGYTTTYGNVITATKSDGSITIRQDVTNKYQKTKLTLTKKWVMNGSCETKPASVTFNVYSKNIQDPAYLVGTYTLNEGNGWTVTIDPADSTLTYYVYETTLTGYTAVGEGKAGGNIASGYKSTITNVFNNGNYKSVNAVKVWTDDELAGTEYRPSEIQMTLYDNTGHEVTEDALHNRIQNPITLNEDNNWIYLWENLVAKDVSIKGYYVVESLPNATDAGILGYPKTAPELLTLSNYGFVGLDNTYQYTTYTVHKVWQNNGGETAPASVTVRLLQSRDNGKSYEEYSGTDSTVTLDEKSGWKYQWQNLPTYYYDAEGAHAILYKTQEDEVKNYQTDYGTITGSMADGYDETITNASLYTTLHVKKTWMHGTQNEADWPNAVSISLLADGEEVYDGILNADNAWEGTFYEMPIYDKNGKKIVYTINEAPVDDYTSSIGRISGDSIGGYQVEVTNTHIDPVPTPAPTEPPVPDVNIPDTGDATNASIWGIVLAASLAAMIGLIVFIRKKSK